MATTTNYGWDTPDDTDLVKDGAAAIRTLGSSIDTTTKNLNPETTLGDLAYRSATANVKTRLALGSAGQVLRVNSGGNAPEWATTADQTPLTTKGDLFTFSTVDARLGVGANGTVLTADSAEATGLKWVAPASGGGMTLLSTTNIGAVTSVTVSITGTGYESLRIAIRDFSLSSSGNPLFVRFNSDALGNYYRTGTKTGFGQSDEVTGSAGGASLIGTTAQVRNSQTDAIWILDILNPEDTTVAKVGHYTSWYQRINDAGEGCESGGFTYKSTSVISSVTFGIQTSGTFSAGDIKVYGIK